MTNRDREWPYGETKSWWQRLFGGGRAVGEWDVTDRTVRKPKRVAKTTYETPDWRDALSVEEAPAPLRQRGDPSPGTGGPERIFRYWVHSVINAVNFQGRASRGEFLSFLGLWFVWAFFISAIVDIFYRIPALAPFIGLSELAPIAILVAFSSLLVRRYHDLGKNGWSLLFSLNPFGILRVFANVFREGDKMANEYGDVPI